MGNEAGTIKGIITAAFAAVSTQLGWYGWVIILWIFTMLVDWVTGSIAAWKRGEWSSRESREGILHKGGCMIVVLCSLILDVLIWVMIHISPDFKIEYSMFLSALVMLWYIVTELGSIVENAHRLGAPVPKFLVKGIRTLEEKITDVGEKAVGDDEDAAEKSENPEPAPEEDTQ